MGNNIMGGVASSNITDGNFGSTSASSAGAIGGSIGGGETLSASQIPTITSSVTQNISTNLPGTIPYTSGSVSTVPVSSAGSLQTPYATTGTWSGSSGPLSTSNTINVTSNNTGRYRFCPSFHLLKQSTL